MHRAKLEAHIEKKKQGSISALRGEHARLRPGAEAQSEGRPHPRMLDEELQKEAAAVEAKMLKEEKEVINSALSKAKQDLEKTKRVQTFNRAVKGNCL